MRGYAKTIIFGTVVANPDSNYVGDNETHVAQFRMAVNSSYKRRDGEVVEDAQFHTVKFFGKAADIVAQYIRKGSTPLVEGVPKTSKYEDKQGNTKYFSFIQGTVIELGPKRITADEEDYSDEEYDDEEYEDEEYDDEEYDDEEEEEYEDDDEYDDDEEYEDDEEYDDDEEYED